MKHLARLILAVTCLLIATGCASLRISSADQEARAVMEALIIQDIRFDSANIRNVVAYLNTYVAEPGRKPPHPASQVILLLPESADEASVPRITMSARQLSFYHAVRSVAELTDLEFTIEDGRPWLRLKE